MAKRIPLIELHAGGIYGFTTAGESHTVLYLDGTEREFVPGVDLDRLPVRALSIYGDGVASDESITITVSLDALDLWAMREVVPTQTIRARLLWWPEGEVLEDRHELFHGVARDPQWSLAEDGGGTVTLTLVPDRRARDVPFPPARIGDEGRFPDAPEVSLSQAVPIIYGRAAGVPLYAVTDPNVDPVRLIVAGHRVLSPVLNPLQDDTALGIRAILEDVDGLGQVYSYVEVSDAEYAAGDNIHASSISGHIGPGPRSLANLLDGLGDVLEHLWRTYSGGNWFELDRGRIARARTALNRLRVGLLINQVEQDGTVLRLIESRLAGQLPFVTGFVGGRYGWDSLLLPDEDTEPAFSLTYGLDAHDRTGPTETSADEVVTRFELDYAVDGYQAGTVASVALNSSNNGDCRRADSRWGESPVRRKSAPDCPDESTAYALITDEARRLTQVRTRVVYSGCPAEMVEVPLLSICVVNDADLGWAEEPCLLEAVAPQPDGTCDVTLITKEGQ